ncbi:MAG: ferrochelatase [Spirochaetia bacterium]|nr:ferrochelatase [Spirochaetia bacterium]
MKNSGILLVNLGSPDTCKTSDVRRYLAEFLMDKRVIDIPFLFRFIIIYFFILPFRPRKSAKAYKQIWTQEGSPLIVNSLYAAESLRKALKNKYSIEISMRYGSLSIVKGLNKLAKENKKIYIIPMFPHYAMSSYETCVEKVKSIASRYFKNIELKFHPPFYNDKDYINSLALTIKPFLKKKIDHIFFSYHGIPLRHLKKTDKTKNHCLQTENCCKKKSNAHLTCYKHQTIETTNLTAKELKISNSQYSICYQSRFSKDSWLSPFTETEIIKAARENKKNILLVCPSFTADCLETLEEIGIRAKENFIKAGGKNLYLASSLNYNKDWISVLKKWIENS